MDPLLLNEPPLKNSAGFIDHFDTVGGTHTVMSCTFVSGTRVVKNSQEFVAESEIRLTLFLRPPRARPPVPAGIVGTDAFFNNI